MDIDRGAGPRRGDCGVHRSTPLTARSPPLAAAAGSSRGHRPLRHLDIGVRSLLWSAGVAAGADRPLTAGQVGAAVAGGLVVAVGLFFVLPAALIRLVDRFLGNVYALNLAEGALRVATLVGYLAAVGRS